MRRLQFIVLLFACAFATGASAEYPERSIHLIVPQAAGSATDTVARILGAALAEEIGQQIIVDDRPGGALTVGLDLTAKAAPDGYTLCMGPIGALAITRHLVANLPYVIERDFQPIVVVAKGHLLLAVSPTTPFQTVTELVAYAKQNPGKLSNASSSNGSPGHVGGELFKFMTGTDIVHVPWPRRRRAGDQRPDRGTRAADVREPQLDCAVRALGRGARAGRERRPPVTGLSRSADHRRGRCAGLCGADLERRHRARRRAAADRRQAQRGDQQGDPVGGLQGTSSPASATSPPAARPEEFAALIASDLAKWGEADQARRASSSSDAGRLKPLPYASNFPHPQLLML